MNDELLDDRVAVPHFHDRLWSELADLHPRPTDQRSNPAMRRHIRPRIAVGIGLFAAAAVAAVVLATPSAVDGPDGAGRRDAQVAGGSDGGGVAMGIVAQIEQVTAESVVHVERTNVSGPDDETWSDQTTGAFRQRQTGVDGQPAYDVGGPLTQSPAEAVMVRSVDHCARTYTEVTWPSLDVGRETRWVADGIEQGWLVEDGTEMLDGRELVRFRLDADGQPTDELSPVTVDGTMPTGVVLVDPESHLPVRTTRDAGTPTESVESYEYLPRNEQSLALVGPPPVPGGYTHVVAPSSDEDWPEPGCGL